MFKGNAKNLNGRQNAQTAIELAVFGAVVIFVLGLIVRSVLASSYAQNYQLRALRLAMLTSFEYSEGLKPQPGSVWRDGSASRNSASVLVMEDRLSVQSGKYGVIDRSPSVSFGTAVHTRNLFMPVDPGEFYNLPVADFFVNGIHFPLTIAGVRTYPFVTAANPNGIVFEKENNHPALNWCDCAGTASSCVDNLPGGPYYRFDLDRNGILDDGVAPDTSMDGICEDFNWQWRAATPQQINLAEGNFTLSDVDNDLFTERILGINGQTEDISGTRITANVMDFQEGDLDFGIPDIDPLNPTSGRPQAGFTSQDVQLLTYSSNPLASGDGVGTYLEIDEGKLYETFGDSRRYVRSAQRKDSIDIVQRTLQLSNDTRRFCDGTGGDSSVVTVGSVLGNQAGWTGVTRNPVETCCPTNECCFTPENIMRVCMVIPNVGGRDPYIFVRSRITDKHGRKWITPTDNDPNVQYLGP